MLAASLLQVNAAPATGLPSASKAVPTSWTVSPRLESDALAPPVEVATETLATTWATVMGAEPLTPFHVALTDALPFPSAVTSPELLTPATVGTLLDQANVTSPVTS